MKTFRIDLSGTYKASYQVHAETMGEAITKLKKDERRRPEVHLVKMQHKQDTDDSWDVTETKS